MSNLSISLLQDPLVLRGRADRHGTARASFIGRFSMPTRNLIDEMAWGAFQEGGRTARVALADFVARWLAVSPPKQKACPIDTGSSSVTMKCALELLSATTLSPITSRRGRRRKANNTLTPFLLERTDIWCDGSHFHAFLRVVVYEGDIRSSSTISMSLDDETFRRVLSEAATAEMQQSLTSPIFTEESRNALMNHVATAVLQERLRGKLDETYDSVAFVADGSILPRKSGASQAPMASPPAVPFQAPHKSEKMAGIVEVDMGGLQEYLTQLPMVPETSKNGTKSAPNVVTLSGLVVRKGVSLIVGGGYHGKSTLLRTIAAGVYNKVPGDGREYCVTVVDAMTVRAEDGRYVNNCNISAFISNLPTPPGVSTAVDTAHFSTGDASGSTSQAANVVEALEFGASALLIDEDVSAANFMARDGRMRSLVMDESITPLLYRVNGLYDAHGVSSIVVVGGVGDWLDVPQSVILMDKYACFDATKKAHSISRQFSHGHVQYAGRGVVHRLPWEKSGTPNPRRPVLSDTFSRESTAISLLDGSDAIVLHQHELGDGRTVLDESDLEEDDDEDHQTADISRCEQLTGKKQQLYGCGLCTVSLLEMAAQNSKLSIRQLLRKLDELVDAHGFAGIVGCPSDHGESWKLLVETLGCAYRPRRFEVGETVTRLRGLQLEELPIEDDGVEAAIKAEAERRKRELRELWNSRRKK